MLGKVFLGILAVFLLLAVFASPIIDGIKSWRTEDITQSAAVTTGEGETTANVTLNSDLYQSDEAEVISISSNLTGENPVATSYDENTNHLLVSALNAGTERILTINYYAETESVVMQAIGPFLAVLVIGGLLSAIAIGVFKKR